MTIFFIRIPQGPARNAHSALSKWSLFCYRTQTNAVAECCNLDDSLDALRKRQRGTLRIVFTINATIFIVIVAAALYASSPALLSDSLDNLGDALTYASVSRVRHSIVSR